MTKKKLSIKEKILRSGWDLFLKQGYEKTTVNQIIKESGTSRGSFYHHFSGKEEILFCMAYDFDINYVNWLENLDESLPALDKLKKLNQFVMKSIEESPYRPLLATLYGLQVKTTSRRHILNPEREYYKIVESFMREAIEKGEVSQAYNYQELTEWYTIIERGLTYDWCLNQGRYSLSKYGKVAVNSFIETIKK